MNTAIKYDIRRASEKIKGWQEESGLKGGEVAKRAGISQAYYSDIRNGNQRGSIEVLASIAEALGKDVNDLIFDSTSDVERKKQAQEIEDHYVSSKIVFEKTVRWARIAANLSQVDLAESLGVELEEVKRWENGQSIPLEEEEDWKARHDFNGKFSKVLGCSIDDLKQGRVEADLNNPHDIRKWYHIALAELMDSDSINTIKNENPLHNAESANLPPHLIDKDDRIPIEKNDEFRALLETLSKEELERASTFIENVGIKVLVEFVQASLEGDQRFFEDYETIIRMRKSRKE